MKDPHHQISRGETSLMGWFGIVLIIALFGWMGNRDREPEEPKCPPPGYGQRLIGSGHAEIDGQGELYCTYATPAAYQDMVAGK